MKFIFINSIFVLSSLTAFAIPPSWPNFWKCQWNNDLTVTSIGVDPSGVELCRKTRSQTCSHFLWGTRYPSYSWDTPCSAYGGTYDYPVENSFEYMEALAIAQAMTSIQLSGISVPNSFMNSDSLYANDSLMQACIEFRFELAGYDIDLSNAIFDDSCFVPIVTLPIIVPLYSLPPINLDCANISPNPVNDNLTIDLVNLHTYVNKIEIISQKTGLSVFNKTTGIGSQEIINVTTYSSGYYNVLIHTSEDFVNRLIFVE